MASRLFLLLIALLVSGQAFARGSVVYICRMTGAVMVKCCCPKQAPLSEAQSAIEKRCCCDIESVAAAEPSPSRDVERTPWLLQQPATPPKTMAETRLVTMQNAPAHSPARSADPPSERHLYLRTRTLLI